MKKLMIMLAIALLPFNGAMASGTVDGSLNTNSGNNATNSHNDSSTTTSTTNHDGDVYQQNGGTQIIEGGHSTSSNSNHTTVDTNQVGNAVLSNLVTGGQDVCLGSATGALTIPGLGAIGGGSTTRDENCELIKQVKLLASLGLKDAAVCLMYQNDEKFSGAISMAYPQLVDLCDPAAKAEKERLELIARYEDAGLPVPAHLQQGTAVDRDMDQVGDTWIGNDGKRRWINDKGQVCRNGTFLGMTTTICQ